jgi:hypothetical protein
MKQSLFRSIRRKLLDEGKLVRYLTYAVGEVVLIIVGIMIALQLNNWNEDRKAQVEFDEYIVQLREDVKLAISVAEDRVEAADGRKLEALTVLDMLEDAKFSADQMETFETALEGLGKYSVRDLDFGHLGRLLEGDLESIERDQRLSYHAMQMAREVKALFSIIEENLEFQKLSHGTFSKHRGMTHSQTPEITVRYNLQLLMSSDEFDFATQNMVYFLSVASYGYARMINHLESFLIVLEEYE